MAKKKIIIEARVNEYTMRDKNPNIPWTPDELARESAQCREAGASVFHFHGRTADGAADLSYGTFKEIVGKVRAASDVLIQPTLGVWVQDSDPTERLGNIIALTADGLRPDFAPIDMGSTNVDLLNDAGTEFINEQHTDGTVYVNPTSTLKLFAEKLREISVKPYLHIWNGPQVRLSGVFYRMGLLDGPLWMGLSHSGESAPIHHPATVAGLEAYLAMIPTGVPVEWTVNAYGANILALARRAVELGGHVSVGIGDYAYPELGTPHNVDLIRAVVGIAAEYGREVATPEEAREILGVAKAIAR